MADILIPIGTPDPVTGARITERYKDMGDGTFARVVSDAGGGGSVTLPDLAALGVPGIDVQGTASAYTQFKKTITAIPDATPTAILTVTIPNGAHSAVIRVDGLFVCGAGGSIGAGESSVGQAVPATLIVARVAGANAGITLDSGTPTNSANVSGGSDITAEVSDGGVVGDVGAVNTVELTVAITYVGAGATNHVAVLVVTVFNHNASGITVA